MRMIRLGFKYRTSPPAPGGNLLLDQYPGAMYAFHLKKLSSSYSGACLRIRRTSDGAEQNIGFDATNYVDKAAISAFAPGGYTVTTWYNQGSAPFNASTANLGQQPTGLVTMDGTELLNFVGNKVLFIPRPNDTFKAMSRFMLVASVGQPTNQTGTTDRFFFHYVPSSGGAGILFYGTSSTNLRISGRRLYTDNNNQITQVRTLGKVYTYTGVHNYDAGTALKVWFDGVSAGSLPTWSGGYGLSDSADPNGIAIGSYQSGTNGTTISSYYNGYIKSLFIYRDHSYNDSTDRTAIESYAL